MNKVASQTEVRKVYVKKTVSQEAAREKECSEGKRMGECSPGELVGSQSQHTLKSVMVT